MELICSMFIMFKTPKTAAQGTRLSIQRKVITDYKAAGAMAKSN